MKSINTILEELGPNHLTASVVLPRESNSLTQGLLDHCRMTLCKQLAARIMADPRLVQHDTGCSLSTVRLTADVVVIRPKDLRRAVIEAYEAGKSNGPPVLPNPVWTTPTEISP